MGDPIPPSAEENAIDCSILVPVLNEERYIERTVEAMRRQRYDGRLEFVFADGGSQDRTREILERLALADPRIRLLANPRRTVSSGLNVALAGARGHWVARMDGHSRYPPDYVALGIARLARGDTRWVSGPSVPVGDNPVSRAIALALRGPLGRGGSLKWSHAADDRDGEFELDSGVFAGVWERATLLGYQGWDERWDCNEDSELAGRFLARGEVLVCLRGMAAEYAPRHTLRGLWRQYHRYGRERAHTAERHPHTVRKSQVLPPGVALALVAAVLGPPSLRRLARGALGVYAAAIGGAGVAAVWADPGSDALLVPVVLATMHVAHGSGSLRFLITHPAAIGRIRQDRRGGVHGSGQSPPDPDVFNPSLRP